MSTTTQYTLKTSGTISGIALHTGNKVNLTLKPAAVNTGYVFKRMDLGDEPTIQAHIDNVKQIERATTLGEGNIKVHTVEHMLSALRGMGVDNALIELDSNEPPIGDGSAKVFTHLIKELGVEAQEGSRKEVFELSEPVGVWGKDGSYLIAWPSKKFKVSCTNANHLNKYTQYFEWSEEDDYQKEIAPSRTFVFYEEVKPLMDKGLIKGGSLENAIIVRGDGLVTKEPLRYENEFVRHKVLDIIGDLALFPFSLKAHIHAAKASHALNVELVKKILKQYKKEISRRMPVENIPKGEGALDTIEVMKVIPHRYPFLLIDRVLRFEGPKKAVGQKCVTVNEPFFQGHFPGHPIMPGVLQLEAMAQLASILMIRHSGDSGKLGYFLSADKVKFRQPVLPGDTLTIEVELLKARGKIAKAVASCFVAGKRVSEAELMFAII